MNVKVKIADLEFKTGDLKLTSVVISLGQNEKSSTCQIVINDPQNLIAASLIKMGGLLNINSNNQTNSNSQINVNFSKPKGGNLSPPPEISKAYEETAKKLINDARKHGINDPGQIAYILATAEKESSMGADMVNENSGNVCGVKHLARGYVQICGEANYKKFKYLGILTDPSLAEREDIASEILIVGMRDGKFTNKKLSDYINGNNRDFYNARRIVNALESADIVANYAENWLKRLPQLDASIPPDTNTNDTKKTEPINKIKETQTTLQNTENNIKGREIEIVIENDEKFYFTHSATSTNHNNKTTIFGQGARWLLARQKLNTAYQNTTMSKLCLLISNRSGLKITLLGEDTELGYVDQSGLSDYQLIIREANKHGYIVRENKEIKEILLNKTRDIKEPELTIDYTDLIGFNIEDKASTDLSPVSQDIEKESKISVDFDTGKIKQNAPQKTDTTAQTGEATPLPTTTTTESNKDREKTARLKQLPSNFSIILNKKTLKLNPGDSIKTKGINDVLDRIWYIDQITHSINNNGNKTELKLYSPLNS